MGNNNATANLTEEENSKLEANGVSLLDSVSVKSTQEQVFLAGEGNDGDKEKKIFPDDITGKETPETEPQSKELVEDSKVKDDDEEMHQSGLENSKTEETDEQLQKQTSVGEGVETVREATLVEELSIIGTQSVVSILNTTESSNEVKPCVIDEIVFVSPSFNETTSVTEEKMVNEFLEEIDPAVEVVKLDQKIGLEQKKGFPEIEPREILNLDHRSVDDEEVRNEGKANQEISKPSSQESNAIQESGVGVSKEEKDVESGREARLKRMSRCRSLPMSHNGIGDSLVQQLVSKVAFHSRNKMGLEKATTSENTFDSCVGSNKEQENTEAITKSDKEARVEMWSPTFGNNLMSFKERSNELMDKTPLLDQDKTNSYKATIDVEEKTVMLKRSETETMRGSELSLGFSMKSTTSSKAENGFTETKDLRDNLLDKEAKPSKTMLVSSIASNTAQETIEAVAGNNNEHAVDTQSPSFGRNLRIEERSFESTEKTPLLCQDKTETNKATIDMIEKIEMLKRSETEKIRGLELSLGLSMKPTTRSEAEDSFAETKGLGDNLLHKEANTSETMLVSCIASNTTQETTEAVTRNNNEHILDMRSSSFGRSLRIEERSFESTEKTLLLYQDKTETNRTTIDLEEKAVMLKGSKTEKTRGLELLGLSMKPTARSEAGDSFTETKSLRDKLVDKIASLSSVKSRVRKRSKSSLFGTCLCCATAMN